MIIDSTIKEEIRKYFLERMTKDTLTAVVYTPYKLSQNEINSVKKELPFFSKYRIINLVDKDIISGFIIKFGTKIIDVSMRNQLKNFQKRLYEIN